MKIVVVDNSVSGHRETYYKQFARTLSDMGHEVVLIAPDGNGMNPQVCFIPIRSRNLLPLPTRQAVTKKITVVRNAFIRLQNLKALRNQLRNIHPDMVFFSCLDDILPTISPLRLFDRLLPYAWSGLLIQSELPAYKTGMPDIRPYLKSRRCLGAGILNECSVDSLKRFQRGIILFPDFADISAPDNSYSLSRQIKEVANGRKIVSLLGSIHPRKGIDLLIKTIPLLPEEDYYFLIAGKSSLDKDQLEQLTTFAASRGNVLFLPDKIPDEASFNALVAGSDLIYAVYHRFTGSSNLLTKAAAFFKPIIVAKGYCMDKRVQQYKLGISVEETDARECASAIGKRCSTPPDKEGMTRYSQDHSINKLPGCFNRIINRLP